MRFVFGKQDFRNEDRALENCFLVTNGLGGYASLSSAFSVTKGDQGVLISAELAPTVRNLLVQRVCEYVETEAGSVWFSSQDFSEDGKDDEDGYRRLSSFIWEDGPHWLYEEGGITLERSLYMKPGQNCTAILYHLENRSSERIVFCAEPGFVGLPKGQAADSAFEYRQTDGKLTVINKQPVDIYISSSEELHEIPARFDVLRYRDDENEGRNKKGWNLRCLRLEVEVLPGQSRCFELLFSDQPMEEDGEAVKKSYLSLQHDLKGRFRFSDPVADQLALSAADYVVHRASTGTSTIIAGYPFFADWGRDSMIALEGLCMVAGRLDTAKEIIGTFLKYERRGLVPNLFPEGGHEPEYNTVDAALLLINCVYKYYERTKDRDFICSVFPVLKRIVEGYRKGTDHGIMMDCDGLIRAGEGLDQVTWMDVCVNGILPTPRHGKPVEINAYWYNALKVMARLAPVCGEKGDGYEAQAEMTKASFIKGFWMEEGCLKDVLSGTDADRQIRCNQIFAVTMPFTMLEKEQERSIVKTVYRELYTPCGLRTLSPEDPQFHPYYKGEQLSRDLAYHQGTVWVFPLGSFYRAWLKVNDYSDEARQWVYDRLACLEPMLREGCVGQLPEIYDGGNPSVSKGCFAQAWSVGEILMVYEALEQASGGIT